MTLVARRVLLLAQNPKHPSNVSKPLEGTRSWRTVKAWLHILDLRASEVVIMNASTKSGKVTYRDYDSAGVSLALSECDRYVALGEYARGLYERLGVPCFTLPHPSGLNRKLNDKQELTRQLELCKLYVQEGRRR